MGCGSSRDVEVQTHYNQYRDTSEPETTVSSVDHGSRMEPEGQESEDAKQDGHPVRGRYKPQRELWAHPPNQSPKRPYPKPKTPRTTQPTQVPGHTVKDLRRRSDRGDKDDNFLMLGEEGNT